MGSVDITTPYMIISNHTAKGNSTGHLNLPLVVGLSVGLPLAILAIIALVLGLVWACRRSAASFEPNTNLNPNPNPNPPKTIQDYPPVSGHGYPPTSTLDPVYENYQAGGSSPYMGPQPPATTNRGQRNDYDYSPRRADPGDTAIYANVPSTFPSRA